MIKMGALLGSQYCINQRHACQKCLKQPLPPLTRHVRKGHCQICEMTKIKGFCAVETGFLHRFRHIAPIWRLFPTKSAISILEMVWLGIAHWRLHSFLRKWKMYQLLLLSSSLTQMTQEKREPLSSFPPQTNQYAARTGHSTSDYLSCFASLMLWCLSGSDQLPFPSSGSLQTSNHPCLFVFFHFITIYI